MATAARGARNRRRVAAMRHSSPAASTGLSFRAETRAAAMATRTVSSIRFLICREREKEICASSTRTRAHTDTHNLTLSRTRGGCEVCKYTRTPQTEFNAHTTQEIRARRAKIHALRAELLMQTPLQTHSGSTTLGTFTRLNERVGYISK